MKKDLDLARRIRGERFHDHRDMQPKTGNEVPVDAKHAVHFKVGRELRELANRSGSKKS